MRFTDKLFQKTDPRAFYGRHTELRKMPGKPECRGLCPLHDEKTPSFYVNLESGSFKCFGCGEGGGPLQFEAKRLGITPKQASKRLAQEFSLNSSRPKPPPAPSPASRLPSPSEKLTTDNRQLTTAVLQALLEHGLPLSDKAVAYFARRKIHPETLDRFQIAFLSDPAKAAQQLQAKFPAEDLQASGAFTPLPSGRLQLIFRNHPLLFPILRDGKPVYLQGRRLSGRGPKYLNLKSVPVPGLFNADRLHELQPRSPVCLCEGAPDAMILDQHGFAALGIVGSGGFKEEWAAPLADFDVHLVLDTDQAGKSGAQRIRDIFHKQDAPVRIVELPEAFKDVNEFFLKHSAADFQALLAAARLEEPDFHVVVQSRLKRIADRNDDYGYLRLARRIFRRFSRNGGIFYNDDQKVSWLLYRGQLHQVGFNKDFNSLMQDEVGIIHSEHHAKILWGGLENECHKRGRRLGRQSWMHVDKKSEALYIHLHGEGHRILRLAGGEAVVLLNGVNPEGVLLTAATRMLPIQFDPGVDPETAVRLLKELITDVLALSPVQRWMVTSWLLCAFLLHYTQDKALLKLSGFTAAGKSTGARMLCCLLYGSDHVTGSTVAADYTNASRNPLVICDNLEAENRSRSLTRFLLLMATGSERDKRKLGTDSETVRESGQALVAVTAMDPLTRQELINRFFEVEFRDLFKRTHFDQSRHLDRIREQRSRILSGLFQLFARRLVPGLLDRSGAALMRLQSQYAGHPKNRLDTFLALMIVVLRTLLGTLHGPEKAEEETWRMVDEWIRDQSSQSEESDRDNSVPLFMLDALSREMAAKGGEFAKEYYLDFDRHETESGVLRGVSFVASTKQLLRCFRILARRKGFELPYASTQQLGVRMAGEAKTIRQGGWEWEPRKIVRGVRYYRFYREME